MKTDELINALAEDARWRRPSLRAVAAALLAAGIVTTATLFLVFIGPRPDIQQALETVRFPFKFVVVVALAVPAAAAAIRMSRPEATLGPWLWLLLLAPLLLLAGAAAELAALPEAMWLSRLMGHNALDCLTLIPSLAVPSLALLLAAIRYGAPTRPRLAGILAGLAAASIAAFFYAANCTDDSPLFVATWYTLAIAIAAAAGGVLGPRLLRW